MSVPAPPTGYHRFLMKSTFGAGRDFVVLDPATEEKLFVVDGKVGARPKADVRDASGAKLYSVRGQLLGIPKKLTVHDAAGNDVAWLRAKAFSVVKDRMDLEMASGDAWHVEGSLMEKDYTVTSAGRDVVRITQKWVTLRDKYTVDVAEGVDVGLALAVVWAIDRWVERD